MVHRKIDKMQADIDEMLELCAETNGSSDSEYQDLGVMILMAQDGELDKKGYRELEQKLIGDKQALSYYVDFQWLSAMLLEENDNTRIHKMMDTILDHSAAPSV